MKVLMLTVSHSTLTLVVFCWSAADVQLNQLTDLLVSSSSSTLCHGRKVTSSLWVSGPNMNFTSLPSLTSRWETWILSHRFITVTVVSSQAGKNTVLVHHPDKWSLHKAATTIKWCKCLWSLLRYDCSSGPLLNYAPQLRTRKTLPCLSPPVHLARHIIHFSHFLLCLLRATRKSRDQNWLASAGSKKFLFALSPQTMGENAPSQLILYHYPELKEDKGVVLMTAEMDPKFIVSLVAF